MYARNGREVLCWHDREPRSYFAQHGGEEMTHRGDRFIEDPAGNHAAIVRGSLGAEVTLDARLIPTS